ncbi:MAG: PP2C family protein-serine/threonine phosphatase, partial [Bacteroidota bacterium]
ERIQRSMLPDAKMLKGIFKESFILYKPKDVVSGDFYWFERINRAGKEYMVIAAADCTGHGVPGAIMSMMGNNLLTNIVYYQNYLDPNKILARMDQEIKYELKQGENPEDSKDGMEMGLCVLDLDTNELDYAGGGIPLYIMRDGELMIYKPDKVMLGGMVGKSEDDNNLNVHHIQLQKKDTLYLCSDGFQDQFGGPQDKKFMAKRLRELFNEISDKPMVEQNEIINDRFSDWKKDTDQTDDVMMLGFRI